MYDNLMKRQITLVDWCCLCRSIGETGFFCCCAVTLHVHYGPLFSWCCSSSIWMDELVWQTIFFCLETSLLCLLWILCRKESYTFEDLDASVQLFNWSHFSTLSLFERILCFGSYLCTHSIVDFSDSLIMIVILIYYIL